MKANAVKINQLYTLTQTAALFHTVEVVQITGREGPTTFTAIPDKGPAKDLTIELSEIESDYAPPKSSKKKGARADVR